MRSRQRKQTNTHLYSENVKATQTNQTNRTNEINIRKKINNLENHNIYTHGLMWKLMFATSVCTLWRGTHHFSAVYGWYDFLTTIYVFRCSCFKASRHQKYRQNKYVRTGNGRRWHVVLGRFCIPISMPLLTTLHMKCTSHFFVVSGVNVRNYFNGLCCFVLCWFVLWALPCAEREHHASTKPLC